MKPVDLRRSVMGAPLEGFRLILKKSNWPIVCRDPAWDISPGGRFFYHFDHAAGGIESNAGGGRECPIAPGQSRTAVAGTGMVNRA